MDKVSHRCEGYPGEPGAMTVCGLSAATEGLSAFGGRWERRHVDVLVAAGAPPLCPACWPEPTELTCPCCGRPVDRATYDRVVAEMARSVRVKEAHGVWEF